MKIQDYLHLYLGCPCVSKRFNLQFESEHTLKAEDLTLLEKGILTSIKPLLRPLSDMTEEEAREVYLLNPYSKGSWLIKSVTVKENFKGFQPNIVEIRWGGKIGNLCNDYSAGTEYLYFNKLDAEQHRYLLSKHFDLFGLIDAGLAIDKTKAA